MKTIFLILVSILTVSCAREEKLKMVDEVAQIYCTCHGGVFKMHYGTLYSSYTCADGKLGSVDHYGMSDVVFFQEPNCEMGVE